MGFPLATAGQGFLLSQTHRKHLSDLHLSGRLRVISNPEGCAKCALKTWLQRINYSPCARVQIKLKQLTKHCIQSLLIKVPQLRLWTGPDKLFMRVSYGLTIYKYISIYPTGNFS